MARYFFDYVNDRGRSHDHQGRDFPSLDSAKRQGELIAIDMQLDQDDDGPVGGKVSICDVAGLELYAIPVQGQAFL
jgi:hypothetical protein